MWRPGLGRRGLRTAIGPDGVPVGALRGTGRVDETHSGPRAAQRPDLPAGQRYAVGWGSQGKGDACLPLCIRSDALRW